MRPVFRGNCNFGSQCHHGSFVNAIMAVAAQIMVVFGPTASGKTALALALAERSGGEILSVDSMQVYRGMDIGTAKPTPEERRSVGII